MHTIVNLYARACVLVARLQTPLLLVIRLYWGWQFAQDGYGMLTHLDKGSDWVASLNVQMPHTTA